MVNIRTTTALIITTFVLLCIASPIPALAATLSVTPSAYSVAAGDVVRVRVLVNSGGDAINTAEGMLQFPTEVLDVVSVDKASSIFSIWVDEPTFSNQLGTVSFSGGLPSPGFTGVSGTVVTVVFHAKRAGTASLSLSGATVRANDGLGTDVLRGTNSATITVATPAVVVPVPVPAPVSAPKPKPVVTPPTPEPTPVEVATTTPASTTPAVVPATVMPESKNPLAETVTFSLGEFNVNIMTLLIMMFFLTLGSFIAASFAWWRLYTYHAPRGHVSKKAVTDINRALRLFKEDMMEHLDALEAAKTKRALTEEELTMKADMKTNFAVLEKYIEDELT